MPFKKADKKINRNGRPIGSKNTKNFIDYFNDIAEEIAVKNNTTSEEVKKILYKVGYAKAKEGNYSFYKDTLDRIHGQATAKSEQLTKMEIDVKDKEKVEKAFDEILKNDPSSSVD